MTKVCTKCHTTKPTVEFYKDSTKKDKLRTDCKMCKDAHTADYRSRCKQSIKARFKVRYQEDSTFKTTVNVRTVLYNASRGYSYSPATADMIGLNTSEEFQNHLQQTFFNTYGYYPRDYMNLHLDHLVPLITADTPEDVVRLSHYSNLRLIFAEHNLHKGTKLESHTLVSSQ